MCTNCRLGLVLMLADGAFFAVSIVLVLLFGHFENSFHIQLLVLRKLHYLGLYTPSGLSHLVELILVLFWVQVVYF